MAEDTTRMEKIVALCKRRGFIFPSSEIYGGIGGFWDYGPLGVELKRNIKEAWWRDMVQSPPPGPDGRELSMVGLDCTIIMNPKVWEASGHVGGFKDPMVSCKTEGCKGLFRADQIFHLLLHRDEGDDPFDYLSVEANAPEDAIEAAKPRADKLSKKHGGGAYIATPMPFAVAATENLAALKCPKCETVGSLTEPREFNLMFESHAGALRDAASKVYLRPETAQGIFVNFKNVLDTQRVKIPFGIAQIGKAFRNEINPRNYTFRSREFEQMEIEFFCREEEAMDWYKFWRKTRFEWYVRHGLRSDKLRLRDQTKEELAHYSRACADIEYLFPFSDEHQELEGVAHRGCYDLTQHAKHSGKDLSYFDDEAWQLDAHKFKDDKDAAKKAKENPPYRFMPTVIEPSAGADRSTLAFLCEAYTEDEAPDEKGAAQQRVVMKFHPRLAPIKAAVFPLVNKEGMPEIAESLYHGLKQEMTAFYDVSGAIGRRYRRQDEIGTPFCITVDGQTLEDETVTVRDRDTLEQVRVKREGLRDWLTQRLAKP